jgi:transmembrane sensor
MQKTYAEPGLPVSEQAAAWFLELAEGPNDLAMRREFVRWLKRSPQHIDAFLAIATLDRELAELPAGLEDTLAGCPGQPAAAVPLPASPTPSAAAPREAPRPPRARRVAGWVAAVTGAVWLRTPPAEAPGLLVHRTDYGEQRSIALADGSIVVLNTLSELAVRFGPETRRVELVSGEAMFDVARDPDRPFVVATGAVDLSVLGTRFSVYRKADSVRLAVLEGVVQAAPPGASQAPVLVRAGQGAVASADGTIRRNDRIDLERVLAWTERRLIFDEVPLADVVAEFNRYNRRPLIVQDPELAERRITSVFFANDVSALVAFLELEPDVQVQYGADAIRIQSAH